MVKWHFLGTRWIKTIDNSEYVFVLCGDSCAQALGCLLYLIPRCKHCVRQTLYKDRASTPPAVYKGARNCPATSRQKEHLEGAILCEKKKTVLNVSISMRNQMPVYIYVIIFLFIDSRIFRNKLLEFVPIHNPPLLWGKSSVYTHIQKSHVT